MIKTLLISIAFTCVTASAFAQQPGIVVNTTGDTIKCEIKSPFIGARKYKTAQMDDFKKFDVKDISYYRTDDLKYVYRSAILPRGRKQVFLEVVEDGKICLYTYTVTTYGYMGATSSTTTWYASKNNGELQELKTNGLFGVKSKKTRQGIFAEMLADNAEVLKQYEETDSFSFDNLRNTVHLYNTGELYKKEEKKEDKKLASKDDAY
jgi:hypothetical protein